MKSCMGVVNDISSGQESVVLVFLNTVRFIEKISVYSSRETHDSSSFIARSFGRQRRFQEDKIGVMSSWLDLNARMSSSQELSSTRMRIGNVTRHPLQRQ